jgi:hypothetical protein
VKVSVSTSDSRTSSTAKIVINPLLTNLPGE